MFRKLRLGVIAISLAVTATAGTFGKVVSIGGQSIDVALDEPRGVMYVADFTGSRIDVISLSTNTVRTTINVPNQPSSISVSPNDHWLVIAHYGNHTAPASQTNMVSVLDLTNNYARQTYSLSDVPLGVAFGLDNNALIVTASSFQLMNPATGEITLLETVQEVATNAIPQAPPDAPLQFTQAAITTSRDGLTIAGFGGGSPNLAFRYSVATQTIISAFYTSTPPGGPRVISLADDGSTMTMAWWMADSNFNDVAEFLAPSGILQTGSHVIDSSRNLVYAQVPSTSSTTNTPVLQIYSGDNLTIEESINIPENLTGKSVLNNAHSVMYSVSQSGVTVLPIGSLNTYHRLTTSVPDLSFHQGFCNRSASQQTFTLSDPGGNATRFAFSNLPSGVTVKPVSGTTPAVITVTIDPNAFAANTGTTQLGLTVSSPDSLAIDLPLNFSLRINSAQPAQVGVTVDIPGIAVDVMPDPIRPAYYVVRQDQNQVMVFNSANNTQSATLRTCTKPTSMAITSDQNYLLVGCDAAHIMPIYDLNLLQEVGFIVLQQDYVESVAVSNNAILAYTRSGADGTYGIDSIDFLNLVGSRLPTLNVWTNGTLAAQGILASSTNGANIIYAGADGLIMIYSDVAGTFVSAQGNFTSLQGSAAASNYNMFAAGPYLLDPTGVPIAQLQTSGGSASGVAFVNQTAYFTTAPTAISASGQNTPGTIAQVDLTTGGVMTPTPMLESPLLVDVSIGVGNFPVPVCTTVTATNGSSSIETCNSTIGGITTTTITTCLNSSSSSSTTSNCSTASSTAPAFTTVTGFSRTIALLNNQSEIVNLTTSGLTIVPWSFASTLTPPSITNVVSAADGVSPPAPGGLIEVLGSQLSPSNLASSVTPLPTVLADSCVAVNGQPIPVIFVSPSEVNAQMPSQASGDVTFQVLTPGGSSTTFLMAVPSNSPAVFMSGTAGPETGLPAIVSVNDGLLITDANPVHRGDSLTIYLTGLGLTDPAVPDGSAPPSSPLALVVLPPTVTLGGQNVNVDFAGLAPGEVGVYQLNVTIPNSAPQGLSVPLVITQNGVSTTVNVRVVQ